jgi:acyl-homoserine lactone synthase
MIYLIDRRNRAAFSQQLEEMFRIRHDIYVNRRGWKALCREDGREIDQFDTEDAVYLLGLNELGRVTSGLRLVPTTRPHLIREVFPHAVTWGRIPSDEKIYEFTRYFIVGDKSGTLRKRRAAGELLCAMFEYGLSAGLTHFSLLCDTFFLPHMLECKWKVRPLGLPTPYEEGTCIAVLFEVSEAAIEGTREARGVRAGRQLVFSNGPPPYGISDFRQVAA